MRWLVYGAIQERHLTDSLVAALRAAGHDAEFVPHQTRIYVTEPDEAVAAEAARRIEAALPADVLFCVRVDEVAPTFVDRLRARGVTTVAWFCDDPLLFGAVTRHVAASYDLTLHTGHEQVLALYEEALGVRGYHFPFYTDDAHYPRTYDPDRAEVEVGFLGNSSAPRERARYPLLASLPFTVRFFGRVAKRDEDWAGLQAGYLAEDEIPAGLARFRIGLSMAQPFDAPVGDQYSWDGVERFGEFFFPSRLVSYAAVGLPAISLQRPAMPRPLATTVVAHDRMAVIAAARALLADVAMRADLSLAARAEFEAHLTAATRVRLLERLLGGPRDHDLAARAELWRTFEGVIVPTLDVVEQLSGARARDARPRVPGPPRLPEPAARRRVLVLGRGLAAATPAGCALADTDAAEVETVAFDVQALPAVAPNPFEAPPGEGILEVDEAWLARAVDTNDVDAIVCLDGVAVGEKGREVLEVPVLDADVHVVAAAIGAPADPPEPGTAAVLGGHPEVRDAIAWRLGRVAPLVAVARASVVVLLDEAAVDEAAAALARGALPIVPEGAAFPPGDGADVSFVSPSRALALALTFVQAPGERDDVVERMRSRVRAQDRWASRWARLLDGVSPTRVRATPRPRIAVVGHWGRGNLGDDLILRAMRARLDADVVAVTYEPERAVVEHGVPAVDIRDLARLREVMRTCALVVMGGGGLLHDLTFGGGSAEDVFGRSTKMLPLMARIGATAQALGVPVALAMIGVGPLASDAGRTIVRFLVERAATVTVRDEVSRDELEACGAPGEVVVGADPVLLSGEAGVGTATTWLRERGIEGGYLVVSVRPWPDAPAGFGGRLVSALGRIGEATGSPLVFVPFDRRADAEAARELMERMRRPAFLADEEGDVVRGLIAGARAVIAMRLHASILAAVEGVPSLGFAYDPKVGAFYDDLGRPEHALALTTPTDDIVDAITTLLEQRDAIASRTATAVGAARARANTAFDAIERLIVEPRPLRATDAAAFDAVMDELRRRLSAT